MADDKKPAGDEKPDPNKRYCLWHRFRDVEMWTKVQYFTPPQARELLELHRVGEIMITDPDDNDRPVSRDEVLPGGLRQRRGWPWG